MAKLTQFVMDISSDQTLLNEFKQNPKKVMADKGLSEEHQELILSKDSQGISRAVAGENELPDNAAFTIGITVSISILS